MAGPAPVMLVPDPASDAAPVRTAYAPGEEMTRGLFVGTGALGIGARHFSFRDGLSPNLREYGLGAAPVVSLGAEVYPLARGGGWPADVGIVGDYQQALFVSSRGSTGSVDTTWRAFDLGARARFRVSTVNVGGSLTYGHTAFDVGSLSPSVAYGYVRPGVDGRYDLRRFSITAGAGYEAVVSHGPLGDLFPRATTGGLDLRVGGGFRLARNVELRATATYARFFWSMNSQPGDANVAGGALDQFMTAAVGVAAAQ
jgi:hypothetical protein